MFLTLLRTRRFAPLFWCQFFSAFNDNFVRNMLAMAILFRLARAEAGALITLAVGLFILPSIFLSGLGGEMADAHDKAKIARALKAAEILVQMLAAAGFWFSSLPTLYAALVGLGVIAALFGPIKYGILPDHLAPHELTAGNALVEAATFLAIILGLVAGGLSAARDRAPETVVLQLVLIAAACFVASLFIPASGIGARGLRVNPNVLASTRDLLRDLKRIPGLWNLSIAVSWFWLTGTVALSLVPVAVRDRTGGAIDVETALSAFFALGIGAGSLAAAILARGRIFLRPVPFAALGMAVFLIDLGIATGTAPGAGGDVGLAAFLQSAKGLRIVFDVVGLATAGGLFVVPLFAAIQYGSPKASRARVIGGVNILNSLFIVGGSLATSVLQSHLVGVSEPVLLGALGVLNLGAAAYVRRRIT